MWPVGADGGPPGAAFFPEGAPALRRLTAGEADDAWTRFRAEVRRRAQDPDACCRNLAAEALARLPPAETPEKSR